MNKRVTVYMKTGRKYVHFCGNFKERDLLNAMLSKTFGLETHKGGFAAYKSKDVERIEIHGNED